MKMNDSVLDFVSHQDNVICALADGYIAAITMGTDRGTPTSDPLLYRIGNTAVQCMAITQFNHVWVGCGKAITILEARSSCTSVDWSYAYVILFYSRFAGPTSL